jgi:glycosyltransferase involved in cell wall biosynthesis
VGVIGKQEGVDLLLRSVEHIARSLGRHDIHFTLVGGGTELDTLREMCSEMSIDEFVTFTGRVDDAQLLEVLNTADVCVNPDVVNEMNDKSTMNKIMEYMALGKPIVQFDLTEGRVSAEDASLYANANDPVDFALKILELIDDPARRLQMGAAGRQRVESELSWQHQEPKLLGLYEAIL